MNYLQFMLIIVIQVGKGCESQPDFQLLSAVIQNIVIGALEPNAITLEIITNYSNSENQKLNTDLVEEILNINTKTEKPIPIILNPPWDSLMDDRLKVRLLMVQRAEDVRLDLDGSVKYYRSLKSVLTTTPKYVVIFTSYQFNEMERIFQLLFDAYILDVIIVMPHTNQVQIFTYFPYHSNRGCSNVLPVLVYTTDGFEKQQPITYDTIFPRKTLNFHQCPIRVVVWNTPPYIDIIGDPTGTVSLQGFDASILDILSKELNFSVEVVPNDPPKIISGVVYPNGTAAGVFKMLQQQRLNLTIGWISCMLNRLEVSTGSNAYFTDHYVIILKNNIMVTPNELLLRPFTKSTWRVLICVAIVKIALLRMIRKHKIKFHSILLLAWLYFLFFFRVGYEGVMNHVITHPPYQPLPQTIEEFIEQNFTLFADDSTNRILDFIPHLKEISHVIHCNPLELLEQLDSLPPKFGIISTEAYIGHFMKMHMENRSDYSILEEIILTGVNCIYYPRGSFLAPVVDDILDWLSNSGIRDKLVKEIGMENVPHSTAVLRQFVYGDSKESSKSETF
uniref:Putative ionotropic receptor ligand binding domain-containing protein n=1 Tax=Musca domestica TaxID=7370 RepID=A0A1I8N0N0_MUSDO